MFEPDWETLLTKAKAAGPSALRALLERLPAGHPIIKTVKAALDKVEAEEKDERAKADLKAEEDKQEALRKLRRSMGLK